MSILTVFTPTYNRSVTLERTYNSLCRQTCKDFEWIVVDDGSTDDTRGCVNAWIEENQIPIRYIYKENGGLHTGYNAAIQNINTELFVCVDSDDFMPDDAVEIIVSTWKKVRDENLAGIIGLDYIAGSNTPIGGFFPENIHKCHFLDFETKKLHGGDTKMVLRTSLVKPYLPMPSFDGEKNFNPIYLFLQVNPELDYILINKNLCFVDYQAGGMSANIYKQFVNSPRSFAELRKIRITHPRIPIKRKIVDMAHLVSSSLFAHDAKLLKVKRYKWLMPVAFPLGLAINLYIRYKIK